MTGINVTTGNELMCATRRSLVLLARVAVGVGAPGLWPTPVHARRGTSRRWCTSDQLCIHGRCDCMQRP